MRISRRWLGLAVLVLAAPVTGWAESPPPDLSGHWVLDRERSEDPLQKMRDAGRERRGRGGGPPAGEEGERRGGGRGGDPRGMPGAAGPEGGSDAGPRARLVERERAARDLVITHREPHLAVKDGIGREWSLEIGAEECDVPLAEGEPVRARATWEVGGRLVVRWVRPYSGPVVSETHELVAEGTRLLVKVRYEGEERRPGFEYLRVYGRAPEAELAAPTTAPVAPTPTPSAAPPSATPAATPAAKAADQEDRS